MALASLILSTDKPSPCVGIVYGLPLPKIGTYVWSWSIILIVPGIDDGSASMTPRLT